MSIHTESIEDLNGNVYASGLTPNQRKRWCHENLPIISRLKYVFVNRDGNRSYKLSLEKHKEKWSENHF